MSLIGYCKDENNLALVLEYMSEGSLDDHLRGLLVYSVNHLMLSFSKKKILYK